MTVDPDLLDLFEQTSERSIDAYTQLRRELADDRRRNDERLSRLEQKVDALVDTRGDEPDGEVVYVARPTRLDIKTVATLLTAFGVAFTPIVLALLNR